MWHIIYLFNNFWTTFFGRLLLVNYYKHSINMK